MNQQQANDYYLRLNQYDFIYYTGPELFFWDTIFGSEEERSLPLLRRFFKNKNCPVTKLTIDRSSILKAGILDILKENKTITELNITYCTISPADKYLLNEIADFLKGNQTIKKLGLHLFMCDPYTNKTNSETRNLFKSLIGTSVTHLDLRDNFLDSDILDHLKDVIPKLKLQSLNLRRNKRNKHTKKLEDSIIYILRRNIFLVEVLVDNEKFSSDTIEKIETNIEENICIRQFFKIFLENYGPKKLGLMDAQRKQSIRDQKRIRLHTDVRQIINQFIPRNIENGVDYFISWLENVKKCLDDIRHYEITDYIQSRYHVYYFKEKKVILDSVIHKLKRYSVYHNYTLTGRNTTFTNLTIGKKQTRGRRKRNQNTQQQQEQGQPSEKKSKIQSTKKKIIFQRIGNSVQGTLIKYKDPETGEEIHETISEENLARKNKEGYYYKQKNNQL